MSNDTLMAIIENTKPYGMKAIPRYIINKNFSLNYEFNTLVTYNPHIQLDLPDTDSISFFIFANISGRIVRSFGRTKIRYCVP